MADTVPDAVPETVPVKKSSSAAKPLLFIGIGCFVLLALLGIGISFLIKQFAAKAGTSLLSGVLEKQTGVKTDLSGIEKGNLTFIDSKTGQQVNVGSTKLPDTFPKDFPVYKGAQVTGSLSGGQAGKGNGFWVTFQTKDSLDKVLTFYKDALKSSGWVSTGEFNVAGASTVSVTKANQEGTVVISSDKGETSIVVALGDKGQTTSTGSVPVETQTPVDTAGE
ncbi:hypothetical protein HY947_04815 [Candidatus Gottesmanbacteria bacterium]|nr:hypothetical protein [Candidatus Gottesmanbacteria bacterium]